MTEDQERKAGEALVKIFQMRPDLEHLDRVRTTWGTKTSIGVFRTIRRIVKQAEAGETIEA